MTIEYDSEGFAEQARKLIASGQSFKVLIRGKAKAMLEPHLRAGMIEDPAKLALTPLLQPLLGVLMFASGKERTVSIERTEEAIALLVSVAQA